MAGLEGLRAQLHAAFNRIIGHAGLLAEEANNRGLRSMHVDLSKISATGRRSVELLERHRPELGRRRPPSFECEVNTPDPGASSPSIESLVAPSEPVSGQLLLISGEGEDQALLGAQLAERGHEVRVATNEREALTLVAQHPFDLALLDITTPPCGGLVVLEALRERYDLYELPVILLGSAEDSALLLTGLRVAANDILLRPLDAELLRARIRTQLALKGSEARLRAMRSQLERARGRVARLAASSSTALQDVGGWCAGVVEEVREATAARRLAVFAANGDGCATVAGDGTVRPPSFEELGQLRQHNRLERRDDLLLAVRGYSGDVAGALALSPAAVLLSEETGQILTTFCAHLGGVLEMDRMRRQLAVAIERRRISQQELLDRGIDVLQVCPECGRCYDQQAHRCREDHNTLIPPPRPLPYRIDNRYRLDWLLGKGGMGTVFRARDQQLDRDVAIKILQARFFDDERMCQRFENEARALARISHPGVIAVHDVGLLDDGSRYIVMELLVGCNLKVLMRTHGRARPTQVATLLRQCGAALDAAHTIGVVHRDIKPENVFVVAGPDGLRFKLIDFGIAKDVCGVGVDLTCSGDLVGTPRYMAPEQLVGQAVDMRSDLYSFAAVAYEALVGKPLVNAADLAHVLLETFRRTPPTISTVRAGTPKAVDRAFSHAFARRRERRPSGVGAWVETFVDLLEEMPSESRGWPDDIAVALARTEAETHIDYQRPVAIEQTGTTANLRALGLADQPREETR